MKTKHYFVKDTSRKSSTQAQLVWQTKNVVCLALGNKWYTAGEGQLVNFDRTNCKQQNGGMFFYCGK